jgi:hypothetical protein
MALSITPAAILSNKTAAASNSTTLTDCTAVAGSNVVALGIEVVMTFHNSATKGATVKVFSSQNGTNYTTTAVQEYDVPVSAGATVRHGFTVLPGHAYYRVQVTNLDTGKSITAISVYAEPQVLT